MKHLILVGLCLTICCAFASAQTPEQKKQTVNYLQSLQVADGGFLPAQAKDSKARSSLRATSAALRALRYSGGEPRDKEACIKFVASCFDRASGGFADRPDGKPDVITTAIGVMAAVELKLPTSGAITYLSDHAKTFEEIRMAAAGLEALGQKSPQAAAWRARVVEQRNADGTQGKGDGTARATAGAAVTVLRLGGKLEHADKVVQALKAGQRTDGGFGQEDKPASDLESTYRVTRAFVMLGGEKGVRHLLPERPEGCFAQKVPDPFFAADVKRCRAFVASCRNGDGGYGVSPGQPSTASATYFASIILHWLSEK